MAAGTPKFQVKELAVKVSGEKFVVDCKGAALLARCGQNTARTFELQTNGNLQQLISDLRTALADLEALDKKKPARKASAKE